MACLNRVTIESIEKDKSSFGALLETWVYSELLKMCTLANEPWNIYYYRDKDQVEVDFILENHARKIIGIEVKASQTILNQDFCIFHSIPITDSSDADHEFHLMPIKDSILSRSRMSNT